MPRSIRERRTVLAALIAAMVCTIVLATRAQQPSKTPPGDFGRAKEAAALIERGQLSLRAAAEMAEKHVKGTAVEVRCDIQSGPAGELERGAPGAPASPAISADRRLVYEVSCFAKDRLETVRVDAAAKKVLDKP